MIKGLKKLKNIIVQDNLKSIGGHLIKVKTAVGNCRHTIKTNKEVPHTYMFVVIPMIYTAIPKNSEVTYIILPKLEEKGGNRERAIEDIVKLIKSILVKTSQRTANTFEGRCTN